MEALNSNNAFRYIWLGWKIAGIYRPATDKIWKNIFWLIYAILVNILVNISFPLACVVLYFKITDMKMFLKILPLSISAIIIPIKSITIFFIKERLLKLRKPFRRLDARAALNHHENKIIQEAINICLRFYRIIAFQFTSLLIFLLITDAYRRSFVIEQWFPFDYQEKYYYHAFAIQFVVLLFLLAEDLGNDTFPPSYIYILLGHMKALNLRVSRIGWNKDLSGTENYQELLNCVEDHNSILEVFKIIQSVIGTATFPQFCITAIIYCLTAAQATIMDSSPDEKFVAYMFLITITLQIIPCCYFGNDFIYQSEKLTTEIYECNWLDQDLKFKKAMITFMSGSQMQNYFVAGGWIRLRMATVADIIKFTFSLFTILASAKSLSN